MATISSTGNYNQVQRDLSEFEDELKADVKSREERAEKQIERSKKASSENVQKAEEEMETTVKNIRKNYEDLFEKETERSRAERAKFDQMTYDKNGKLNQEREAILEETKNKITSAKEDFNHQKKTLLQKNDDRIASIQENADEKIKRNAEIARESGKKEITDALRSREDLSELKRKLIHDQNEAKASYIKETESKNELEKQLLKANSDAEIRNIHRKLDEIVENKNQQNYETMKKQEASLTGIIRRDHRDHQEQIQEIRRGYGTQMENTENRVRALKQEYQDDLAKNNRYQQDLSERTLKKQAESYQASMKNQNDRNQSEIEQLEKELHVAKTSPDLKDLSPRAENQLRDQIQREWKKEIDARNERNSQQFDHLKNKYQNQYEEISRDSEFEKTMLMQDKIKTENHLRSSHASHLVEKDYEMKTKLRDLEGQQNRILDRSKTDHFREIEKQRLHFEEIVNQIKSDSDAKLQEALESHRFESQIRNREFANKINELSRQKEREIQTQKNQYEVLIEDMKTQQAKELRSLEKRNQDEYAKIVKNNEKRIQELELKYKEREMSAEQAHQDQIARMKASNEIRNKA